MSSSLETNIALTDAKTLLPAPLAPSEQAVTFMYFSLRPGYHTFPQAIVHDAAHTSLDLRTFRLPGDQSLRLLVGPERASTREVETSPYWWFGQFPDWTNLVEIQGQVVAPVDQCLGVIANSASGGVISFLTNLKPDELEVLVFACEQSADKPKDDALSFLSTFTGLKTLVLDQTQISDTGLKALRQFKSLERLAVVSEQIGDEGIARIAACRSLKGLRLSLGRLGPASVAPLSRLTELEELFLGGAGVEDEGLGVLTNLPSLRRLALRNVSSGGLKRVSELTSLRRLELYGTAFNENQHLQCLSNLTNLQSLDLTGFHATDETLGQLKSLRSLKRLRLSPSAYVPLPGISEAGLAHLQAMPSLEIVELYGSGRITDEGLGHLAGLTNLRTLIIPNMTCEFTDAGLARLSQLTRLEHLYLRVRGITDWGLLQLQRLPSLKKLELWRESLTDAGLNRFRQARPAVELKIGGETPKAPEETKP